MSNNFSRLLLLSSSAIVWFPDMGDIARAQEQLPTVEVTAPSPIRRRPPPRPRVATRAPAPRTAPRRPAAPDPAPVETPTAGVVPVVVEQFATITVVPNEEIRRSTGQTLGDLLLKKPGITGSSFAPGASSRPIIRGLDVNRVGIVQDGIGGSGASDLGEDHFVPINPLVTNQVEVIRGPAALRYGSTSIGGLVSATDNRIPDAFPPCRDAGPLSTYGLVTKAPPIASRQDCVNFESRTAASSVDNGLEGAGLLDAASGNYASRADAFGHRAGDYRIPSYPYRFEPGRPFDGKQPNSRLHTDGESVGGSYLFEGGFVGAALIQDNALYHIPGIDGEDHHTRIDAHQTKLISKGEWRSPSPIIDSIRFWAGATNYKHHEIGLADPADPFSDGVRQIFQNQEEEARVETQLVPFNLRFAELTTALGIQAGHQRLTAPSPDNAGLWDPNRNTRVAGYAFNEFKFSETTKAQIAGRIETIDLSGFGRSFPGVGVVSTPTSPSYTPKSASAGLIQNLVWDLVGSITAQYVERAPKPAELFSGGPHDATGTFDKGNPDLKIEVAESVEAGLRRAVGPLRFELTGYYTHFKGFIFRHLTGDFCDGDTAVCGPPGTGDLKEAIYTQRDANFRGAEFQFQYDVAPLWMGIWGVEGQYDIVRATFTDGTNVPR